VLVFDATALAAVLDAHPLVWMWWKRAHDGRVTLGFPATAMVEVGQSGEATPNQWATLLWPETIEVLPLGESAAVEIGSWSAGAHHSPNHMGGARQQPPPDPEPRRPPNQPPQHPRWPA
jgi:hypothetical protein